MVQQYYFRINGLVSEDCILKIEQALQSLQGVEILEIDLETQMAIIKSDNVANVVASAIDAAGYNAILIPG